MSLASIHRPLMLFAVCLCALCLPACSEDFPAHKRRAGAIGPAGPRASSAAKPSVGGTVADLEGPTPASSLEARPGSKSGPVVEAGIPPYVQTLRASGALSAVGSDTMNNLLAFWTGAFQDIHASVKPTVEGKGSSTGPIALTEGTTLLAPMSRAMKSEEIQKFSQRYGYKPTAVRVAVDGLAIFVHADNPLTQLTLPQVDAIFSSTRSGGHPEDLTEWGQLGISSWKGRPFSLFGRNSASGTYGFMKEKALFHGDFRSTVKEQPGSASVVQGIGEDRYAIGYSGLGYTTSNVKMLALQGRDGQYYSPADSEQVLNGKYPLARFLYIYVNRAPDQPLNPLTAEFLRFVLSKEGQEIVVKDHYLPLPTRIVEAEWKKLGLSP